MTASAWVVVPDTAEQIAAVVRQCRRLVTKRALLAAGVADARLAEFRWLLEELRVSLFAQELRTPQPVSVKRLEKTWAQLAA